MAQSQPKAAAEMVAEIDAEDVALIDIRKDDERVQNGAIPNSVSAPRGMLEFWANPTSAYHRQEFDPSRHTILYCASGGRSALATETLQRMGYGDVAHLEGGIKAWKEEGQPVEEVRSS